MLYIDIVTSITRVTLYTETGLPVVREAGLKRDLSPVHLSSMSTAVRRDASACDSSKSSCSRRAASSLHAPES